MDLIIGYRDSSKFPHVWSYEKTSILSIQRYCSGILSVCLLKIFILFTRVKMTKYFCRGPEIDKHAQFLAEPHAEIVVPQVWLAGVTLQ